MKTLERKFEYRYFYVRLIKNKFLIIPKNACTFIYSSTYELNSDRIIDLFDLDKLLKRTIIVYLVKEKTS